jgi:hypothetical protein
LREQAQDARASGDVDGLIALLQLKLELRQVLRNAGLTNAYDQLIRDAEAALTQFEADSRQAARAATLDEAADILAGDEVTE